MRLALALFPTSSYARLGLSPPSDSESTPSLFRALHHVIKVSHARTISVFQPLPSSPRALALISVPRPATAALEHHVPWPSLSIPPAGLSVKFQRSISLDPA